MRRAIFFVIIKRAAVLTLCFAALICVLDVLIGKVNMKVETLTNNAVVRANVKAKAQTDLDAEVKVRLNAGVKAAEMRMRQARLRSACSALPFPMKRPQRVNSVLAPKVGARYCDVPKVGSSFLKRVFYTLENGARGANPLAIGGEEVHEKLKSADRGTGNTSIGVVFARDPFTRIYSAHIDKTFLMPVPVFNAIVYMQKTLDANFSYYEIPKRLHLKILNLSFADSIEYATGTYCPKRDIERGTCPNEHFMPVSHYCDVCNASYDIVGNMETFNADVEYFLDSVNRSDVYKAMGNVDKNNAVEIVTDIINRVRDKYQTMWLINADDALCSLLYRRAWKVFQMRGFVSDEFKFPKEFLSLKCGRDAAVDGLVAAATRAVRGSGDRQALRRQKQRYVLAAFRSVPIAILRRFQDSVRNDCALYGYDCNKPDIFQGRKEGDEERNFFSDISVSLDG